MINHGLNTNLIYLRGVSEHVSDISPQLVSFLVVEHQRISVVAVEQNDLDEGEHDHPYVSRFETHFVLVHPRDCVHSFQYHFVDMFAATHRYYQELYVPAMRFFSIKTNRKRFLYKFKSVADQ